MKKLIAITVFTLLLIPAIGYGQVFEKFNVREELPDGTKPEVKDGDWIHESRDLLVEYPKGCVIEVAITENGYLISSGNLDSFITEGEVVEVAEGRELLEGRRVPIKVKPGTEFGLGAKDGQEIVITAKKKGESGKYVYYGSREFRVYKPGLVLSRANSFNVDPLFVREVGKKVRPEGVKTKDYNAYFGGSILLFIKSARAKFLSDTGFGINVSYANTELIEEGEKTSEGKNVVNAGGVIAYKISKAPLLYLMGVGGWGGLNVPASEFVYFGAGLAYPIPL